MLYDKLSHACIIDGIKLSNATAKRFKHNDMGSLENLLTKHRSQFKHCLVITETIFSMDGDHAPIEQIAKLAKKLDAWSMVDNAHGIAITKPHSNIDIHMGTLSKGVGAYGGYISAKQPIIDFITNAARSQIFTTGLPPSVIASAIKSIEILTQETTRMEQPILHSNEVANRLGVTPTHSPILPITLGTETNTIRVSHALADEGIYVPVIRPPTVPKNTSRLRLSFSTNHSNMNIDQLCKILQRLLNE